MFETHSIHGGEEIFTNFVGKIPIMRNLDNWMLVGIMVKKPNHIRELNMLTTCHQFTDWLITHPCNITCECEDINELVNPGS
jgi:hypothetical protein